MRGGHFCPPACITNQRSGISQFFTRENPGHSPDIQSLNRRIAIANNEAHSPLPNPYGGSPGVYGTLGSHAPTNIPGGRFSAVSWIDASGNFWLSGGDGYDSTGAQGYLNDLWEYTPSATGDTGQWTWISGSNTVGRSGGEVGVYGTLRTAASTNDPGGRFGAVSWIDLSGKLWFFGGDGYDSTGAQSYLNDLWQFQP